MSSLRTVPCWQLAPSLSSRRHLECGARLQLALQNEGVSCPSRQHVHFNCGTATSHVLQLLLSHLQAKHHNLRDG
jgi:hypothetical protein